jgi:hypothetical protein
MRNHRKLSLLFTLIIGMAALAAFARYLLIDRPQVDKNDVIFTDDYRLSDIYRDSLAVVADTVALDADSYVTGDAALVGDTTQVNGRVDGDLTLVGDALVLGTDAQVGGNLSAMGSDIRLEGIVEGQVTVIGDSLSIHRDAQISGAIVACVETITDLRPDAPPIQPCRDDTALLALFQPLQALSQEFDLAQLAQSSGMRGAGLLFSLSASLLLTGLSALAVIIFPRNISLMQDAILSNPRDLAALGVMSVLLLIGLSAGMAFLLQWIPVLGVIFVPLGLLLGLAFLIMVIGGWITIGLLLGDFVVRQIARSILPPAITVAVGSLILFTLWHGLALLPFGGIVMLLLMAVLGSAGLGAALATRLGTRPLRRRYFVQG